jgi:hypothetical protein
LKQPTESNETSEQMLLWQRFFQEVRLLSAAWLSTWMPNFRSIGAAALLFGKDDQPEQERIMD